VNDVATIDFEPMLISGAMLAPAPNIAQRSTGGNCPTGVYGQSVPRNFAGKVLRREIVKLAGATKSR
jgi:hypothetical protein